MSKSFEQIFSESNPHGFGGYEGPCTCCKPKSTDKVTKAYARGVQEERDRTIKLLENLLIEEFFPDRHTYERLHNQLITQILTRIKGENK